MRRLGRTKTVLALVCPFHPATKRYPGSPGKGREASIVVERMTTAAGNWCESAQKSSQEAPRGQRGEAKQAERDTSTWLIGI